MALTPLTLRVADQHRDLLRETGRRLRLDPDRFAQSLRDLLAAQGGGGVVQLVEQVALADMRLSSLEARVVVLERAGGSGGGGGDGAALECLNSTGPGSEK